jgi:hypothetical protein
VGLDPTGDVALVKLLGRDDFPFAEMGDSDRLRPGDWVFAMGNPFLLATDFQPTVTSGIISGVHRYQFPSGTMLEYADCLQTDASINPGNSGGPLFDGQGRVVGINGRCSFDKRGRVSVDVGYAISINQIKNFLGVLRSGRIVDHATLGARVAADDQGRVVVTDILETSDAYRRGLRLDDEILAFAGRPSTTPNGFKNALGIFPKGWRVPLVFRHEGQTVQTFVRLDGVHTREQLIEKTLGRPNHPGPVPKPGEKEEKGKPRPKLPQMPQMQPQKAPMPEAVKKVFEAKHGFANYYFNKQEQDRVLKAWKRPGDPKRIGGSWAFTGKLESGKEIHVRISDADAAMEAPIGNSEWKLAPNFAETVRKGGNPLLPALFLYRLMAVEGPKAFGETYYVGTMPLPGLDGMLDVVVANYRGVDTWCYFEPNGRLAAMEVFPEEHADPLEMRLLNYRTAEGGETPGTFQIYAAGKPYVSFDVGPFLFGEAGK